MVAVCLVIALAVFSSVIEGKFQLIHEQENSTPLEKVAATASTCQIGAVYFAGNGKTSWCQGSQTDCWPQTLTATFDTAFASPPPAVCIGINHLDAGEQSGTIRISSSVTNVTASSFKLTAKRWEDSKLFSVRFDYIACM